MQNDLAFDLIHQTVRTANTLLRESRRLFRPHGLTEAQFNVLSALAADGVGLSQRELSDILVVDRSNVTGLLDRMESLGWVRRDAVPGDRRVYRVRLTSRGRRLWESVFPAYERAVFEAVRPIGSKAARAGVETLQRLEKEAEVIGRSLENGRRQPS